MSNDDVKKIIRKHYIQILSEIQSALGVEDIQKISDLEIKYSDKNGNKFKIG